MKCPSCLQKQITIIKYNKHTTPNETQNTSEICQNKACGLYVNIDKLEEWTIAKLQNGEDKVYTE